MKRSEQMTPNQKRQSLVTRYFDRLGRLNHLTGIIGAQDLKKGQEASRKNREAEEAFVRKNVWGVGDEEMEEEMGDTIFLGDISMNEEKDMRTQPPQQNGGMSTGKKLAIAGLAAAGMGAAGLMGATAVAVPTAAYMYMNRDKGEFVDSGEPLNLAGQVAFTPRVSTWVKLL